MDATTSVNAIIKRLYKAFPECGIITIALMAGSYDQLRESSEFYKELSLKYFNENIA